MKMLRFIFITAPVWIATGLTIIFLSPILLHLSTHLPSREDGIFIAWTINWVSTALAHGQNIFQAPLFFPYQNTLAYSDLFVSTAILNWPLLLFTKNIVLMSNLHLLIGTVVNFLAMFWLAGQLRFSKIGQYFTAVFWSFSSLHLQYLVHLHTYLLAGIPFTVFFFLRWLDQKKWGWLLLSCLAFLYQALNSPMSGYFLTSILLIVGASHWSKVWQLIQQQKILVLTYGLAVAAVIGFFYLPYFQVAQQFHYARTIRDAAHFGTSLESFVQPELLVSGTLLLVLGRKKLLKLGWPVWCCILGGVLMLGPVLKFHDQTVKVFGLPIPLPYSIFYYLVPGFKAFRASSRWVVVLHFGLSLWLGWSFTFSKFSPRWKVTIFIAFVTFLFWSQVPQLKVYPIPPVPPIYREVRQQSAQVLAEFPVYSWRMITQAYHEDDRLLFQAEHGKTLFNGVSGFTPPQREQEMDWLWQEFPSPKTLAVLHDQGVQLVLIHFDEYQQLFAQQFSYAQHATPDPTALRTTLDSTPELDLVTCQQQKCLYRLTGIVH